MPTFAITAPDGRKFNITAPEGASQEEVMAYAQSNFPAPEAQPEAATAEPKGFLGRLNQDLQQRGANLADTVDRQSREEQNPLRSLLQVAGTEVGAAGDVIGAGVSGAVGMLPEAIKQPFKDIGTAAMETDTGRSARRLAGKGVKKYGKFKKENPALAADFEALGNIVTAFTPIKGKSVAGIVEDIGSGAIKKTADVGGALESRLKENLKSDPIQTSDEIAQLAGES